jgi:hypothetical protein
MTSKHWITQRLLEKIESELKPDDYKIYRSVYTSFIKGEIGYPDYQEKMVQILGVRLLPFHQRFVNLFRKRVIENKSIQRYKSILIRIKKDKREARLNKLNIMDSKNMQSEEHSNLGR